MNMQLFSVEQLYIIDRLLYLNVVSPCVLMYDYKEPAFFVSFSSRSIVMEIFL